jgi:hypothetical protein
LRTCRGQTTILEDADVTYRMKPMKESMDDFRMDFEFDGRNYP